MSSDLKHELSVLETSIAFKKDQLSRLDKEVANKQRSVKDSSNDLKQTLDSLETKIEILTFKEIGLKSTLETLMMDIRSKKVALAAIDSELIERHRYLKDQESLIDKTIDEGNMTLKAINYEIIGFEEQKKTVNGELYDLNKDKSDLLDAIGLTEENLVAAEYQYSNQESELNTKLNELNAKITEAESKLKSIATEVDSKLNILRTKEESLLAKQSALKKEQAELNTDKRRFEGKRSLYL